MWLLKKMAAAGIQMVVTPENDEELLAPGQPVEPWLSLRQQNVAAAVRPQRYSLCMACFLYRFLCVCAAAAE